MRMLLTKKVIWMYIIIGMTLLTGMLLNDALAIGPTCPPCNELQFDSCSGTIRCMGCTIDYGACYNCDPPYCPSKCHPETNCKDCNWVVTSPYCVTCAGCTHNNCDPTQCQTCDGHGNCVVCDGDANKDCCNGTCYDKRTQQCCHDNPTKDYICDSNKPCCLVTCCPPDQCCGLNPFGLPGCVKKCDPEGDTCPHEKPDVQAGCQRVSPTNYQCLPDQVGKTCTWTVVYEYSTSAKCASCASGCSRTNDVPCASYKAETCRMVLFIGCMCNYDGDEGARPTATSGAHYVCD